jgi:DNA-binding NarL/FixJ family response regulator
MEKKITIAMAEDHPVFRQGLIALLKEEQSIEVLFDVENGLELLKRLQDIQPNVVLLDIEMPVMDGHETYRRIKSEYPEVKVIMLSTHFHPIYVHEYIKGGAGAFLPKNTSLKEIVFAITSVHYEGFYYGDKVKSILDVFTRRESEEDAKCVRAGLTDREIEVYKLLRDGKGNAEIAKALNISLRTAEWHRQNLNHKLMEYGKAEMRDWSTRG